LLTPRGTAPAPGAHMQPSAHSPIAAAITL
jgi:hypothetical protein